MPPQLLNHEGNFQNKWKAKLFLEVISRKAPRAQFITGSSPAPEAGAGAEELLELFKELSKVWKVVEAAQRLWGDPSLACSYSVAGRQIFV